MHQELNQFISEEKTERIKKLPDLGQRYITDLYINALRFADEDSREQIIQSLEHDITTLEAQENSKNVAFNQEREDGFVKLEENLRELLSADPSGKEMEKWLAASCNNVFRIPEDKVLQASDFSSVRILFVQSATAAVLTNREVSRPVIVFEEKAQLAKFLSLFSMTESTNGVFFPIAGRGDLPSYILPEYQSLARAGLLVSKPDAQTTLSHEIRHSIDPLVMARDGFDAILNELYAYATQINLNKEKLKTILNHNTYITNNLEGEVRIDKANKEKGYAPKNHFGEKEKNAETHKIFVENAVDTFFKDIEKMGVIKALRRLGTSASLEDYINISSQMKLRTLFN